MFLIYNIGHNYSIPKLKDFDYLGDKKSSNAIYDSTFKNICFDFAKFFHNRSHKNHKCLVKNENYLIAYMLEKFHILFKS